MVYFGFTWAGQIVIAVLFAGGIAGARLFRGGANKSPRSSSMLEMTPEQRPVAAERYKGTGPRAGLPDPESPPGGSFTRDRVDGRSEMPRLRPHQLVPIQMASDTTCAQPVFRKTPDRQPLIDTGPNVLASPLLAG